MSPALTSDLTVSVVSHGHGELVVDLLADLRRYAPDARIVLTFNIPEPEFDRSRWEGVIFRDNSAPKGFGANHNAALQDARTTWLAIVNPDIRLTETALPALSDAASASPKVAMWAPAVIAPDGVAQDSARALPTPSRIARRVWRRLTGGSSINERGERPSWFAGMFLLVDRDAFAGVGGFDERFFLYGEDVALSISMVARGYPIARAQHAVVIHDARRATLRSLKHLRWHVASLLRLWCSRDFYRHERRYSGLEGSA